MNSQNTTSTTDSLLEIIATEGETSFFRYYIANYRPPKTPINASVSSNGKTVSFVATPHSDPLTRKPNSKVKLGVVAASVNHKTKKVSIGWSLCNTSMGDNFDSVRGLKIAKGRMPKHSGKLTAKFIDNLLIAVPNSLHDELGRILGRCDRILNPKKTSRTKKK